VKRFACPLLLQLLLLPVAVAAPRDDYAQQWPLTLARDDAGAYRVTLDENVYRQLQDPVIGDAVVLNRDGVAVPTDVFAPQEPLAKPALRVALPWFALPSAPADGAQGWELVSQADADGRLRRVEVRTRDAASAALPRNALLVDVSRVHEAIAALKRALQIAPLYADAHFNLASCYEQVGQLANAAHHWEQYLKLDSTSEWAKVAQQRLRAL